MTIFNRPAGCSLSLIVNIFLLTIFPTVNSLHCRPCSINTVSKSLELRKPSTIQLNAKNKFGFDPPATWKSIKEIAPPVVTGAYEDDETAEAGDAIYNLIFVRFPTIAGGLVYFQRVADHAPPIMMDFGFGDYAEFELSPIIVLAAMFLILRPG
jgi:hypothetical protein